MVLMVQAWAHQVGWYMCNCLLSGESEVLFKVVDTHAERLASRMSDTDDDEESDGTLLLDGKKEEQTTQALQSAREKVARSKKHEALKEFLSSFAEEPPVDYAVEENVVFASEEFGLNEIDCMLLLLIVRYSNNRLLEDFCDEVHNEAGTIAAALAALTNQRVDDIQARICIGSPLIENGVLVIDLGGNGLSGIHGELRMTPALQKSMLRPHVNRENWIASLLGRQLTAELPWSDYEHLGKAADLARRALIGWVANPEPGLNIMLVGPPGTGKTEFAKTLAQASGLRVWSVGESDEGDKEPSRAQRLAALRLSFAVLRNKKDCLLLLDEASDVLPSTRSFGSRKGEHSKLFLNRTLETNPTPVLWACNDTHDMDHATLRRMTQVIEIKVPDPRARCRIWNRVLGRYNMNLGPDVAKYMAERWPAPPAMVDNAVRLAHMAGGGQAEIEVALFSSMHLMGMSPQIPERDGHLFDAELAVCNQDLQDFAAKASKPGAPLGWCALFYGPPGTTKSEYARYLATQMGLEIYRLRASDLLSKWVGESEAKIAAAFAEARSRNAMLIIDEIEALIFNRNKASHSWEVSQVDEILTWMEEHPLPFVATTNALTQMDSASLRRFTYKFHFNTLDPRRTALAFKKILGAEPPDVLPEGLAPGDFAVLKKKIALLGEQTPLTLARWLQEEMDAKGSMPREIGFRSRMAPEQLQEYRD